MFKGNQALLPALPLLIIPDFAHVFFTVWASQSRNPAGAACAGGRVVLIQSPQVGS